MINLLLVEENNNEVEFETSKSDLLEIVNVSKEKEDQTSSESLIGNFKENSKYIDTIPIKSIIKLEAPFEFKCTINKTFPTLLLSNNNYYCIDNFKAVQDAKSAEIETINVVVIPLKCDATELSLLIKKLAVRVRNDDMPNYSEILSFIAFIRNKYLLIKNGHNIESLSNFKVGGDRKSNKYKELLDSDLITKIAKECGRTRDHVKVIFDHAAYLNENLLEKLRKYRVKKSFYETIEPFKKKFVSKLIKEELNADEISIHINKLVRYSLSNWLRNRRAKTERRIDFLIRAVKTYFEERDCVESEKIKTRSMEVFNPHVPELQDNDTLDDKNSADLKTDFDLQIDEIINKTNALCDEIISFFQSIKNLQTCKERYNTLILALRRIQEVEDLLKEGVTKEVIL